MKIKSLSGKIVASFCVFAIMLIVGICGSVGTYYWNNTLETYYELAYSYAKTAATYVDGDKVLGYLETGEKDEYYEQYLDFLNATQKESNIIYYSIFVPNEIDYVYVWDADGIGEACELGYHEAYVEDGYETVMKAYDNAADQELFFYVHEEYGFMASAVAPVLNSQGEPVAVAWVDLSAPGIRTALMTYIGIIIACVVSIVAVAIVLFYIFIRRNVVRPISILNDATKNMVEHLETGEDFVVDVHTGDEIRQLADSFGQMNREIKDYIKRLSAVTAEKERIGAELNVATQIQADMLPSIFPAFPEREEFDIFASMTPAKEVGGDFYDFFMVGEDHLVSVIADVSGKGVPAALFMVIAKTLIKNSAERGLSPKEVLEQVNYQLCQNNKEEMFVTVWLGKLELSTGKLVCANAGHDDPIVVHENGEITILQQRHGFVLAGMEMARYREQEFMLEPGDKLFAYTDGVSEATDALNELYGRDRILNVLNGAAGYTTTETVHKMKEDVDIFVGEAPQFDDITMLCLQYQKEN